MLRQNGSRHEIRIDGTILGFQITGGGRNAESKTDKNGFEAGTGFPEAVSEIPADASTMQQAQGSTSQPEPVTTVTEH